MVGVHATLTKSRDGLTLRCERGASVQVDDEAQVRKASLALGAVIDIAGNRLTLIDAPGGFDAAITVELNTDIEASDFENVPVTTLLVGRTSQPSGTPSPSLSIVSSRQKGVRSNISTLE